MELKAAIYKKNQSQRDIDVYILDERNKGDCVGRGTEFGRRWMEKEFRIFF